MMMVIGLVLLGLVIVLILWAIGSYNQLIRLKALLDEGWSGIDVQLKRRYDLIPNLVSTVQGYSIHEKTVLEDVTRMRAATVHATGFQEKTAAEAGLSQALKTLFAVSERYPDLKANTNFLSLQKELSHIEHELQLARRYYNGTARNYNSTLGSFPTNLIASTFGFDKVPYFEIAASHERDVPTVKF